MSDNGSARIITPGQHRTVADLSSRDRSQLMDETLMTVHELLLQVAGMGQAILALKREKDALEAKHKAAIADLATWSAFNMHTKVINDHSAFVSRSFLARLGWLIFGL